jgi:hypothetical protein
MGRKKSPGLVKRGVIWHLDKRIGGRRVCQSTGSAELEEAENVVARLIEETRQAQLYGVRPQRTFEQAAAKFVVENSHKRSLDTDVIRLKQLMPWVGQISLDRLHRGTLDLWVAHRQRDGAAAGTINHGLKVVRRILNLAATEWMDEHGLTWIQAAPKIKLLPDREKIRPYPLSWDEQAKLFSELPGHLAAMALFAVNTGCRDGEICPLRWEWEEQVSALETSVFIIPDRYVKNGDDRVRGAESGGAQRDRCAARKASGVGVCLSRQADPTDAELGVEKGTGADGATAGSRARSQAHVRAAASRRRREL